MRSIALMALSAGLLFGTVAAGAGNAGADEAAFAAAASRFTQAARGDADATAKAITDFKQLSEQQPTHPLYRAYYGATLSIAARDASDPWKKMTFVEDGLAELDKALAQLRAEHEQQQTRGVPVWLETRFTAATTFLALPPMFNRGEAGRKQLNQITGHASFAAAPAGFRSQVLSLAARTARSDGKADDEIRYLKLAAAIDTPAAQAARNRLKELGL